MTLLRCVRLRALLRPDVPLEDFAQLVFCARDGSWDRQLSVYELASEHVVRGFAEHMASFASPPRPDTGGGLNLADLRPTDAILASLGATRFVFANEAHREVLSPDDEAVRRLAADAHAELAWRDCTPPATNVKQYVFVAVTNDDPEWLALLADPKKRDWRKWCSAELP